MHHLALPSTVTMALLSKCVPYTQGWDRRGRVGRIFSASSQSNRRNRQHTHRGGRYIRQCRAHARRRAAQFKQGVGATGAMLRCQRGKPAARKSGSAAAVCVVAAAVSAACSQRLQAGVARPAGPAEAAQPPHFCCRARQAAIQARASATLSSSPLLPPEAAREGRGKYGCSECAYKQQG